MVTGRMKAFSREEKRKEMHWAFGAKALKNSLHQGKE